MMGRKRFKAIIIGKKTLSAVLICFVAGVTFGGVFFFSKTVAHVSAQTSVSDDIYRLALESELPLENEEEEVNFFEKLLGFDLLSPESILMATPIFDVLNIEYPDGNYGIEKTPEPRNEEQSEEFKIEDTSISKGMSISNATNYNVDAEVLASKPMDFELSGEGAQVLIVHTHTTESYTEDGKTTYTLEDSDRNTDENKNMVRVGKRICEVLNNAGIKTVHDTTVHDYPSYNGAYNRALATIKKNMAENPDIKVVLDVHRDGMTRADGTKLKVTADIDGKETAQVMLVVGSDAGGLEHDLWQSNMIFASKLQKAAEEMYPSLMRPINLREERFNQHMTKGSLILEVGSNGNTMDEALLGGEYIANVIAKVLKNQ